MSIQKQVAVPIAQKTSSDFPLYSDHVTTTNFMELNVAKAMELVPNQSVKYQMQTYTRLEPLVKPTFGRAEIRNRHFFVPFRTAFPGWNDFITDVPHMFSDGTHELISHVPVIYNKTFVELFVEYGLCSPVVPNHDLTEPKEDFTLVKMDGTTKKYIFSALGRVVYKNLRALGYSPVMDERCTTYDSAMPLLCMMRVYYDWYFPSQYATSSYSTDFRSLLERDTPFVQGQSYMTTDHLFRCVWAMTIISYDSDYFISAWDNPDGPEYGLASEQNIFDINGTDNVNDQLTTVSNTTYGENSTPGIYGENYISNISQYMLTALRSMSDYMKRHQLAGSRVIDRYLARHGIKLQSESLKRSILLGEQRNAIKFTDVMSSASTEGAVLGSFAGQAQGVVNDTINFECTEYGMLISISTIVPYSQYYQGIDRHIKHIGKLDFWTEEYDALGSQLIYKSELNAPLTNPFDGFANNMNEYNEQGFGFTGRYGEYKKANSLITGDYILNSRNVGQDAWTLFRDVSTILPNDLIHGYSFIMGSDADQYNRIFTTPGIETDKFNVIHSFEIQTKFPGKRLFDTYEFEDEDKSRKVTLPIGGTTLS